MDLNNQIMLYTEALTKLLCLMLRNVIACLIVGV